MVGAFFLISAGGGSSTDSASAYPPGYSPPVQGDSAAPVEMVMYGDFQCPSCKSFETVSLPELRARYVDQGKVRFVWRNFEHYGEESVAAAKAAHCAGEQGKFWEFHDVLYRNQRGIGSGAFSRTNLLAFAEQLNLKAGRFGTCLDSPKYDGVLAGDYNMARDQGVNGTPGFFINGQYVAGAQPLNTFVSIIDAALAKAQ
jgi:protein-disulfide isomerase